ncbi:ImmA/IrrE family metallo-endopeptidase [Halalkalibacter krulwichiae]|uniref:IrrE N-terminal-like domain-containing protein n=1 Tax=Halalkalibacter krulwichiae TaxID=199441 RepID=A0A1X9MFF1_9BACI|nr:ImmA/IrrE family metallo-endopeptidase [Halalkalibacter krulwichiae]ARK32185.1 hypothetical protein BkAM31D_21330 [Halalkalibacter krulwichiae]
MLYYPTPLETWIYILYKRLGIYLPSEIDEQVIAQKLGIYLYYKPIPSSSYENGRFKSITIDSRKTKKEQREDFFHELCHLLRHVGWQAGMMMPEAFRELQEHDSINFTRYAAIPFHMLKLFDIHDEQVVFHISESCNVTTTLVTDRLERIKYSAVSRIIAKGGTI